MSWLSKNVIDVVEKDVEGFFSASSPVSTQVKSSVAAIGTTALAQVDPVVTALEAGAEGVIDTALASLGPIGVVGEAGAKLMYPILTEALNAVIARKLGVPAPASPTPPV